MSRSFARFSTATFAAKPLLPTRPPEVDPHQVLWLDRILARLDPRLDVAGAHLALLLPEVFPEMGKLNLTGELSLVFGVLSMWCLAVTAITSLPFMYEAVGAERWQRGQRMGYLSLMLTAGHVLVMGFAGWLVPAGWHGGLPPVSLVAFIAASVPLLLELFLTMPTGLSPE